ncbi:MAG TPA: DNA glycosylase [Dehalococcoidia bacterium]|nr:DNA glycosylase [Dehalococcoidia bacterium]
MELAVEGPFDLAASLESGQAHRWRKEDQWYSGVVRGNFIEIRQTPRGVEFCSEPWPEVSVVPVLQNYFRLDDDLRAIYQEIMQDRRVADMVDRYPGLRVLRQEPWECLIAFICSANSNIPRIHQVMEKMADHFGNPISLNGEVRHAFPTPTQLAKAGEAELRRLGLGFRAPYVDRATRLVLEKSLELDALIKMPYDEAKARLMECPGIGPKIADCILVFSLEKMEAFPIDVWVRRALAEWYFPGEKTPTNRVLEQWAHGYFGRYGGYAQQYLFHGRRLEK